MLTAVLYSRLKEMARSLAVSDWRSEPRVTRSSSGASYVQRGDLSSNHPDNV